MNLKNERIIKALFYDTIKNDDRKGAIILHTTENLKSIINIKTVEPSKLLSDLESKVVSINDTICLKGYLSNFGCMSEPKSFQPVIYKRGANIHGDIPLNVRALSPPVSNFITKETCIAFLYVGDENPFLFHKNEHSYIEVHDHNKFLPIIMKNDDYIQFTDNFVEIHCSIKDVLGDDIKKLFKYQNQAFCELTEWFINIGYVRHPFIQLISESVKIIDHIPFQNQISVFAVEYKIIRSKDMPNDYFRLALDKAFTNSLGFNDSFRSMHIRDTEVTYLFTRNQDITVIKKNEELGFFIEIDFMDIMDYSSKIKELHKSILDFRNNLKASIELELVFLSDMRKKLDFQLDN